MNFVENILEKVVESKTGGQSSNAGSGSYGPGPQAPQVYPPWVARWDERDGRWFYVNEQTGERSWQHPGYGATQGQYGGGGGYGGGYGGQQSYGYREESYQQRGYQEQGYEQRGYQQEAPKKNHNMAYGAAGVAAGVVGGALLMHEGEKIGDEWDQDKYRVENDVENFPENAARWTGDKVGEVEAIPQDIENDYDQAKYNTEQRFDNAVDDVEDFPEEAAGWVGEGVGNVERFGDNMDNAYDEGRDEGRDGW